MAKGRFPRGGMPGGNMQQMLKQAQKMQENLLKAQEEFDEKLFEASSGGGAVTIKISGKNEIKELKINPEVVDPDDVEMLEDLVISAVNEAVKTVEKSKADSMNKVAGGLGNLGGLF